MDKIEETLKRIYEEILIDCIKAGPCTSSFIKEEMEDGKFVLFIKIKGGETTKYKIKTEAGSSFLFVEIDKHKVEIDALLQEYSLDDLVVEDAREWYDTYLVPRLHNAFAAMEL